MTALTEKELTNFLSGIEVYDQGGRRWVKEYLDPPRVMDRGFWWVEQVMGEVSNSWLLIQKYGPITMDPPVDMSPLSDLYLESYNIPVAELIEASFDELIAEEKAKVTEKTFYVDPVTGGKKEVKQAQLGAIDPTSLLELAKVAGHGAEKYETYNYLLGYPWSLNFNSAQRHLLAFWSGENIDSESGHPHLAHAAWHCLALLSFMNHDLGTDDRWVPPAVDRSTEDVLE